MQSTSERKKMQRHDNEGCQLQHFSPTFSPRILLIHVYGTKEGMSNRAQQDAPSIM